MIHKLVDKCIFSDSNHKPEMAIALTKFEALCGFRTIEEIVSNMSLYPEFAAIMGNEGNNNDSSTCIYNTTLYLFHSF